jgi:dihydroflavonol-4-reductase
MKALVTGATGFIGSHLVAQLLRSGWDVRALVRDPARAGRLAEEGVELAKGDLDDESSLGAAGVGVDVVFHSAAQLNLPGVSAAEYTRTNIEGTRRLVRALKPLSLKRFVHISSIAAIGIRNVHRIAEEFPCDPDLAYGKSKLAVDRLLIEEAAGGFPAVIVRPPTVYGPGERYNFLSLCRAIAARRFLLIGSGLNRIDFCWVGNLVQAMILAAERGRAGHLYQVSDEPALPFVETSEVLARLLTGSGVPRLRVPVAAAYLAAYPMEAVERLTGRVMPLNPKRVRTMSADMCFDLTKAKRELGYAPEGPFRDLAARTVEWYRTEGLLAA